MQYGLSTKDSFLRLVNSLDEFGLNLLQMKTTLHYYSPCWCWSQACPNHGVVIFATLFSFRVSLCMYWAQNCLSTRFAVSTVTTFVFFCCLTVQLCTHRSKRRNSYNVIIHVHVCILWSNEVWLFAPLICFPSITVMHGLIWVEGGGRGRKNG